jgi:riboflavin kinase / FMN adenylyltransferase
VFDGVHLGHRALLRTLSNGARTEGARAVAATFDPLPIQVFAPGAPASALSDARERVRLLRDAGAESVVVFRFDVDFSRLSAHEFIDRVRGAGDVRRIVVGPDFHFGHRAQGDVQMLRERGARDGFAVDVVAPFQLDGTVVSSTRIRNLLLGGDVTAAARLLGRPYTMRGRVLPGARRGQALGYPTINVELPRDRLLPRDGIYAAWADLGEAHFQAAASLHAGSGRILEAHLLDVAGDIHSEELEIAFVRRLRDEIAFASPDELSARIAQDVEDTRRALRS